MTNGEKFKEVFKISQVDEGELHAYVWLPDHNAAETNIDWWNAEYEEPTNDNCAEKNGCTFCSLENGEDCCRKLYEDSMQDLVTENTSESKSNEMIAAHILESINEGFNKERLLHSWFGDNRRRDLAFKRAILALRAIDNIGNNMEEYYFSCLDLPSVTSIDKEYPNCGVHLSEVNK